MGTNIYIGLTKEEVKYRIKKGLVNYNTDLPTKSVGEILFNNIFTLFNMLYFYCITYFICWFI